MGDVFRYEEGKGGPLARLGINCKGLRPWLGEGKTGRTDCGRFLRVLQRGATNVYFPHVVSAIYLPFWAEGTEADIAALLEQARVWEVLSQRTVNGRIDPGVCGIVAQMTGVEAKRLEAAAQRKLDGGVEASRNVGSDEEEFRRSEYQAICDGKMGRQTELYVECVDRSAYGAALGRFFSKVRLVHKLRETRALAGFTRILPPDGALESARLQPLALDPAIDWLPAIKVYGEGMFLELDSSEVDRWTRIDAVTERIAPLVERYNAARAARLQPVRHVLAKFVLMHTLAHVIINQLSFDCGYGSASLRERLYCDINDPSRPMQGILIYTASGDSEGTMGGLVRQAKPGRLEATLRRALDRAAWCSSDPVCVESEGQGSDSANLAACHSCCLVPETSCEEGNRLLDRALLVGTPANPGLGFFQLS